MGESSPRTLLIAGIERSGTTMVTHFVNTHADIEVSIEMGVFLRLNCWVHDHARALWPVLQLRLQSKWRTEYATRYTRYFAALTPAMWHRIRFRDAAHSMRFVFPENRIVGDKLPRYLSCLHQIPEDEQVCMVLTYRDARAVINSGLKRRRNDPVWQNAEWASIYERPTDAAKRWLAHMDIIARYSERAMLIEYESFVVNPQPHIDRLSAILNVDPAGFDKSRIHQQSLDTWRGELPRAVVREIESVAGERLASLGYPV